MVVMYTEGDQFKYPYAWFSPDGAPAVGLDIPTNVAAFSWEIEQIRKNGYIYFPVASKIPKEARIIRSRAKTIGIKSMVMLPIQTKNVVFGYLAISSITRHCYWGDDSLALLKIVAQIFSNALERKAILRRDAQLQGGI